MSNFLDDTAFGPTVVKTGAVKQKHAPKAPVGEYRKMPELGSQEYAKTRRKVDRYHEVTHRSKELIESDILVNPGLNLQLTT
jgi:hypothetical protein